jgi:hypothetical protein
VPPGRCDLPVRFEQRHAFAAAAAAAHAARWRPAADAIRRGLEAEVPADGLALLTWRDLERRVCGERAVTLDALRAIAVTDASLAGTPQETWLWRLLAEVDDQTRGRFLAFSTGRSRMPAAPSRGQLKLSMDRPREGSATALRLPFASTCSFTFKAPPAAASYEQFRDGVLYACAHCNTIETDGHTRGEMFGGDADGASGSGGGGADAEDASAAAALVVPLFGDADDGGADDAAELQAAIAAAAAAAVEPASDAERADDMSDDDQSDSD